MAGAWRGCGERRPLNAERGNLWSDVGRLALPVMLTLLLCRHLIFAGFAEPKDFTLGFSARLLADVGLSRLDIVGLLGGPELNYALALSPPMALAAHTMLFGVLGDSPAAQTAATIMLHLMTVLAVMWVARLWREDRAASFAAGVVVAAHPIAVGAAQGIAEFGAVLATFSLLMAVGLTLRFVRDGNRLTIGPLMLAGLFAVSSDAAGLAVVPASAVVALTAPLRRRVSRSAALIAPVAVLVGALTPLAYLMALRGPRLYFAQLIGPPWRLLADYVAWALRLFTLPGAIGVPAWTERLSIALLCALMLTLTAYRARQMPTLLVWPALVAVGLWPRLAVLKAPTPVAETAVFAAGYLPLAFVACWLADLTPASRGRRALYVLLLLVVLVPQALVVGHSRAGQAELVNRLGREMNQIIQRAPVGADVLLPVSPTQSRLIETAFLAGQYQTAAPHQIRYRLVMGGRLTAAPKSTPLGENARGFARLPFKNESVVIAPSADRRHLVDLSARIRTMIAQAEEVIRREKHAPPEWLLLDEPALDRWDTGGGRAGLMPLSPDDFAWFVEGYFYRLHPHLGQITF